MRWNEIRNVVLETPENPSNHHSWWMKNWIVLMRIDAKLGLLSYDDDKKRKTVNIVS